MFKKKSNHSIVNLLLFSFFIFSCSNKNFAEANLHDFNTEDIKFDVVEKTYLLMIPYQIYQKII